MSGKKNTILLWRQIKDGISLLSPGEARQAALVCISILVNALLQMFALVGIVPFVQALIDMEGFLSSRIGVGLLWLFPGISNQHLLLLCGIGLLALVFVKNVYNWLHLGWQNRFVSQCETRMRMELMKQMLASPYAWISTQNSIFLREVVFNYPGIWAVQFIRTLLIFTNDFALLVTISTILIYVNPVTGIAIFIGAGLVGGVILKSSRRVLTELVERKRRAVLAAAHTCIDTLLGFKDVLMTSTGQVFEDEFRRHAIIASRSEARLGQWNAFPRLCIEIVGFGTLLSISTFAVTQGAPTSEVVSVIAIYALAAMRIMPILATLLTNVTGIFNALPMVKIILETQAASTISEPSTSSLLPKLWENFRCSSISYSYENSTQPALKDINLEIKRGGTYGLVGRSGAGKSTLIDVISGLLVPSNGELLLDDKIMTRPDILNWRHQIGYVAQSPYLLDTSLSENIAFCGPGGKIDMAQLDRAISIAQLTDVVANLPDGIDTRVGERGVMLSGGQRQRVAIARAIYRETDILILDEATSSLDSLSEQEFNTEIKALEGKVTLIIVAHRLATVRNCDEIWVMDNSKLVAYGAHDVLMETSTEYQSLLNAQNTGPSNSTARRGH